MVANGGMRFLVGSTCKINELERERNDYFLCGTIASQSLERELVTSCSIIYKLNPRRYCTSLLALLYRKKTKLRVTRFHLDERLFVGTARTMNFRGP